jgi:hypothetical protein
MRPRSSRSPEEEEASNSEKSSRSVGQTTEERFENRDNVLDPESKSAQKLIKSRGVRGSSLVHITCCIIVWTHLRSGHPTARVGSAHYVIDRRPFISWPRSTNFNSPGWPGYLPGSYDLAGEERRDPGNEDINPRTADRARVDPRNSIARMSPALITGRIST